MRRLWCWHPRGPPSVTWTREQCARFTGCASRLGGATMTKHRPLVQPVARHVAANPGAEDERPRGCSRRLLESYRRDGTAARAAGWVVSRVQPQLVLSGCARLGRGDFEQGRGDAAAAVGRGDLDELEVAAGVGQVDIGRVVGDPAGVVAHDGAHGDPAHELIVDLGDVHEGVAVGEDGEDARDLFGACVAGDGGESRVIAGRVEGAGGVGGGGSGHLRGGLQVGPPSPRRAPCALARVGSA